MDRVVLFRQEPFQIQVSAKKCDRFYCGNCSCKISKCPSCKSEKQLVQDKSIDLIASEIFDKDKVVEENLNFAILSVGSLKNLRQENSLNYIIKGKEDENDLVESLEVYPKVLLKIVLQFLHQNYLGQ